MLGVRDEDTKFESFWKAGNGERGLELLDDCRSGDCGICILGTLGFPISFGESLGKPALSC